MRILVLGDSCVDRYVTGEVKRINPEAPTVILNPVGPVDEQPGMAANVYRGFQALAEDGWQVDFLTNKNETKKTRFVDKASGYILLRVDENDKVEPIVDLSLIPQYDHYIISDYAKGFITEAVVRALSTRSGKVWIDTKMPLERWSQYVHCVKINSKEFSESQTKGDINWAPNLVVTRGGDGAEYWQYGGLRRKYSGVKSEVRDVCGAGDSFLAGLVAEYIRTENWDKAIDYANRVAAVAVSRRGTVVVQRGDIVCL